MKKIFFLILILLIAGVTLSAQQMIDSWLFGGSYQITVNSLRFDEFNGDLEVLYDIDFQSQQGWKFERITITPTLIAFKNDELVLSLDDGTQVEASNPGIRLNEIPIAFGESKQATSFDETNQSIFIVNGADFFLASNICQDSRFIEMEAGEYIWSSGHGYVSEDNQNDCCAIRKGKPSGYYMDVSIEVEYQNMEVRPIDRTASQFLMHKFTHPVNLSELCVN